MRPLHDVTAHDDAPPRHAAAVAAAMKLTRGALTSALGALAALKIPFNGPASASVATAVAREQQQVAAPMPTLVLGAGGGTGSECVNYLLARGLPCIATTRSGALDVEPNPLLTVAAADVASVDSLRAAITPKLGAVIFAASASAKGGDAKAIDEKGVVDAAKLCIECGVKRYVVVSSGTVTRPDSAVYQLLNVVGKGIMEAKIKGEDEVRRLYSTEKDVGYTIVRPGGLTRDEALGVGAVELNQGDTKSGRIARADVAAICVEAIGNADAFDTTFECYWGDTAKEVESVGLSNLLGVTGLKKTEATQRQTGLERRGDTWAKLFKGLARDVPGECKG